MRPIASAKPGNPFVQIQNKKIRYHLLTVASYSPKRLINHPVTELERKRKRLLAFLIKDIFLIFTEGCVDCFMENLEKDIEE